MGIENENFVLVGSLNTLSLVYMTEYYKKKQNDTHIHVPKTHSQRKFYPSADNFTQALLVMLVTNIMSALHVFATILDQKTFSISRLSC